MTWLLLAVTLFVGFFAFVLLYGAPYLPTLKRQIDTALDLADLKPGQRLLELGCGDGRVLRAAAKRGINGVGYELNPLLVVVAKLYTWRYRKQVRIIWGNFWVGDWPEAQAIFVFLLDKYMEKLNNKITQQYSGKKVKLVSFAFRVPSKKPAKAHDGVFLYTY